MHLRNVSRILRSAHLLDKLIEETGLTWKQIDERVRLNQFERHGLDAPALETVQAYFKLTRPLTLDSQADGVPSWLMAIAREFPGSHRKFFHLVFDILFGVEASKVRPAFLAARVPKQWIREETEAGHDDTADFLDALNRKIGDKAPQRRKEPARASAIEDAHRMMLRLPQPMLLTLFDRAGDSEHLVRSYRAIDQEVGQLLEHDCLDGLAGLLLLFRESAAMGDVHRFTVAKTAVEMYVPRLADLPECRRIYAQLSSVVTNFCVVEAPPLYTLGMRFEAGLPPSWQRPLPSLDEFIPGHQRGDQPDNLEFYAERHVSIAALRARSRRVVVREPGTRRYSVSDDRIAELTENQSIRHVRGVVAQFKDVAAAIEEIKVPTKHVAMPSYEAWGSGNNWVLTLLRRAHVLVIMLQLPGDADTDSVPDEFVWTSAQREYLASRTELSGLIKGLTEYLRNGAAKPDPCKGPRPQAELFDSATDT